jgi:multicomponent Na+:H+ antiporter subunit F
VSLQTVLVGASVVLLSVSAVLVLVRLVRGPSVLDRTIATEVIISILVCGLALNIAATRSATTLPVLVSLALTGFVGSVAVARFVAGDHDRGRDAAEDGHLGATGEDAGAPAGDAGDEGPRSPRPGQDVAPERPADVAEGVDRPAEDAGEGGGRRG